MAYTSFSAHDIASISIKTSTNNGTQWMEINLVADDGERSSITLFPSSPKAWDRMLELEHGAMPPTSANEPELAQRSIV